MEMVLDGADAPNSHLVNLLDETQRFMEYAMIEFAVATERTPAFTVRSILGRQHWIQLDDDLWSCHLDSPCAAETWAICATDNTTSRSDFQRRSHTPARPGR